MTINEEHIIKIDELADEMAKAIKGKAYQLLDSGGVAVHKYNTNDYELAGILVTAAARDCAYLYSKPHDKDTLSVINNLRYF